MVTKKNFSLASYKGIPYDSRLEYASYAAMQAATGLISSQVGHVGKITADNSYWILEQITPCLKWKLFSGKDVSRAEETIYVDWDTGNDTTGNGSATYKYKSHRFLDDLQKSTSDHDYRIKAAASENYDYFPKHFKPYTEGGGRIIFDSSDETFPVYAGPFTVTGVAYDAGGAGAYGVAHSSLLTVAGAGWTVDEFYGKSIRMTSGNWAGYVLYLHGNTADTITTIADWYTFQVGDEFEIVTEPVVITVAHPIVIEGNSRIHKYNTETTPDTPLEPSLLMSGYRFKSSFFSPFRLENLNLYISGVTFWGSHASTSSSPIMTRNCSINYDDVPSGTFDGGATFEDFYALATQSVGIDGNPVMASPITNVLAQGHLTIAQMSMRGEIRFEATAEWSSAFGLQCGKITGLNANMVVVEYAYIEQHGFDTLSLVCTGSGEMSIVSAYCKHNEGFLWARSTNVGISWLKGEDCIAQYAANLGSGAYVRLLAPSNVAAPGTVGAVKMPFPSAAPGPYTWANWPIVNEIQTNLGGTYCVGDAT